LILFETSRLVVRQWEESDLDHIFHLYSDPAVMQFIRATLSLEETRHILLSHLEHYKKYPFEGRFGVLEKSTNHFIGTFLLKPSDAVEGMEIGYAFLKAYWGQGLATELVKGGIAFAFSKAGLDELFAITQVSNETSKNVLRKSGFRQLDNILEHGKEVNLFYLQNSINQ
jgi:ribosomal-protein-alanine N-acetyltransferase